MIKITVETIDFGSYIVILQSSNLSVVICCRALFPPPVFFLRICPSIQFLQFI